MGVRIGTHVSQNSIEKIYTMDSRKVQPNQLSGSFNLPEPDARLGSGNTMEERQTSCLD